MEKEYFLGLDMGTGSVGWAVTDNRYEVLRSHGKALWGVRLFESANTAEERRMFRTARRRLDRRNWRIQILQELFAEEIAAVDPGFYLRMKESKYYPEDKRDTKGNCPDLPYALFVDRNYTDEEYHAQFPTIYHLRKYLMNTSETPDIRLIYLAIHHMMKHRGHFLLSGDISQIKEFKGTFLQMILNLKNEELEWEIETEDKELEFIEKILKNKELTKNAKKSTLIKHLKAKTACEKAILTLLSGGTVKLCDIFANEELNECERPKISFSDSEYDDYIGSVESALGEQYCIIESIKAVYDWSVLVEILGDSSSISEAKVKVYEKHRQDLKYLKKVVREELSSDEYKKIFVETSDKLNNYCAYIGMTKKNGKKVDLLSKQCSKEDFYDFLKKSVIKNIADPDTKEYLEKEIEQGSFLPKQVNKENGVIPYQVHLHELKEILRNMEEKLPFIKENKEKLIQLFEFRIPYYVGPLNSTEGKDEKFTWAVRKSKEKIYPWNFTEIVDVEESAEKFIRRMTNKCTYLVGEDVLPKDSLLYSKFMVLNELNNLRLDGEKLSVELKKKIYEEVFCKYRKVTVKKLKKYLRCQGIADEKVEISGINGEFKAQLNSYHDFKEKLTNLELSQKAKEEIILNIVLFGEDKKLLKQRLHKRFPELTDGQLKGICTLSYKGWGRLSGKFLEGITAPDPETGEVWTIIRTMWETNDNLMQILSRNYMFADEIKAFNSGRKNTELSYKTVEELYVSPAVKRQIWQTLKIVKEIKKVMGADPQRVFVEMAREKQESKRTESRKKQLQDLYKACRKEEPEWIDELCGQLDELQEHQLRSDKLYLYYTQKGRCMYSGERIDLGDLWDNQKYDIDHIYPQSKTMDDSLGNRVLVKKSLNHDKTDIYPIKKEIRDKMSPFWKSLLEHGFISKKKYERLTRATELEPDELAGFIERQLVETRQSTKAVAEILQMALPHTEIVYVKAGNVSRFRQDFELIKVRDMNDLHHAKDAYLNIVVGNSYYVKFTKNAAWYVKENPGRSYNLKTMFTSEKKDIVRNDELAWKAGNNGTITTVKKFMKKNNILVTRKAYEVKGGLFKQQPLKKRKGQFSLKSSDKRLCDIQKYGGYTEITGSYFVLVKSKDKKGKIKRTIEFVPVYLREIIENDEKESYRYLTSNCGLLEPEIILKIKKDSLFEINRSKLWISGRKSRYLIFKNANQVILEDSLVRTLKLLRNFEERRKENKEIRITPYDKITEDKLLKLYDAFEDKMESAVYKFILDKEVKTLKEGKNMFLQMSIEEKCNLLIKISHLLQCRSIRENLKEIGGSSEAGRLILKKDISQYESCVLITQSVTGIFDKEINLLTL